MTSGSDPDSDNPCVRCGACCALFRVSFHWSEADAATGGRTPAELSVRVTLHRVAMRGTEKVPIRCVALEGEIGKRARCAIYPARPSPCHEFRASWIDGTRNERCDRARAAYGLPPLEPPGPA